jgi:hypothetical protein
MGRMESVVLRKMHAGFGGGMRGSLAKSEESPFPPYNPGIPSSRYLWAAKAKVHKAIVTINQRKRLTRWGQTA